MRENLSKLERKVFFIQNASIDMISNRFSPVRDKCSKKVAVIQSNLDYHPDNNTLEKKLENKGFLNCYLCVDAQTQVQHTEPDASYTIISVPKQITNYKDKEPPKKGRFEFMLNKKETLSIIMHPGLILAYSGYMITHRQQIITRHGLSSPFINLVSYNSKRLFSNLMESFRRVIKMDKKTLSRKK